MTDPNQPPQTPVSSEWDQSGPPPDGTPWDLSPAPAAMRAAVLLWVCAAIQVLLFGCLLLICFTVTRLTPDQWRQLLSKSPTPLPAGIDPAQVRTVMMYTLVMLTAAGLAPALGHLILAFAVRRAHRGLTGLALWLAAAQFVVLALIAAMGLVGSAGGQPPAVLLLSMAIWAAVLVPLGMAIAALRRARRGDTSTGEHG
jgi:hypothetical protein